MAETTIPAEALKRAEAAAQLELSNLQSGMVDNVLTEALPVPDVMFGGFMLVLVIMYHAFWIRLLTNMVLKRFLHLRSRASMWRADLSFAGVIISLLALHLGEVFLWSAGLIFGDIVDGWERAAYFAGNCYTALGEPFSLPHAWRMLAPIIAISGIFTFAWTASVLVDVVARYNKLRAEILVERQLRPAARKR